MLLPNVQNHGEKDKECSWERLVKTGPNRVCFTLVKVEDLRKGFHCKS